MRGFVEFFCLHRKFLVYNLVLRNLKIRYRKSTLGFLWTLLVPASMAAVYYFVFMFIIRMKVEHYLLFLMTGLIPWTFFSTSISSGTEVLVTNFGILSKVPISYQALPFAEAGSELVNFVLSLPVLIAICLLYHIYPSWPWLAVPFIVGILFLQTYAFTLFFAISHVYLRDVKHLVGIFMQIWMYMTPILYTESLIPERYRPFFMLNPVYGVFSSMHSVFVDGKWPTMPAMVQMITWTIALLTAAYWLHRRVQKRLVEEI